MSYGIIVTKSGSDARNATDPRSWALNTNYPMLKVVTKGSGVLDGVPASATINHALGYNPLSLIYVEDVINPGKYRRATGDSSAGDPYIKNTPADPNNIYILDDFASNQNYFFYVFYDETLT